ncbi:hypothetical protein EON65_16320 [archaeon]|nr:MAG: hypothetical protein EON65_16320 [archaeon]
MEFEHVGRHCSLPTCGQKDFLPFQCDYCHGSFCLEHRQYGAHGCAGGDSKDMTSIDCPICSKTVKFDKSQDINLVWNEHYNTVCTQKPTSNTKLAAKCARGDCRNHLGPSNSWTCTKCLKPVCLTHRLPEDHQCTAAAKPAASTARTNPRSNFLDKIEANTKKPAKLPTTQPIAKSATSGKAAADSSSNPLKETAARRAKQDDQAASSSKPASSAILFCPFCNMGIDGADALQRHVNNAHPDPTRSASQASPPPSSSGPEASELFYFFFMLFAHTSLCIYMTLPIQVCPMCSMRFADPVALIQHCEMQHNDSGAPASSSTSNGNTRDCRIF